MRDQGGNLKSAGLDRYPGLVTRNGLPLDRAREMAAEAGYLGHDTTHAVANTDINDLLDAIGSHPRYSAHDEGVVANREQRAKEVAHQKEFGAARKQVISVLRNEHAFTDAELDQRLLNHAAYNFMEGHDPLDAYELALRRAAEHDEGQRRAIREAQDQDIPFDDFPRSPGADAGGTRGSQAGDAASPWRGSGAPYANDAKPSSRGASAPSSGNAYRLPTAEDAASLRLADAAFKQHQQTYNEGPLKPVMAPGARTGEYKTPDYAVPAKVLRNGPAGYRTVKAYLDGANNASEAVESLKAAMAETLRPKIKDGMLSGKDLAAWKNRLSHALRAVDEASPGFSARFNDAASASDAVLQAARAKVEQSRAFKASAIGKFLGVEDADGVVARAGRLLTSDDGAAKMREAVEATKSDPAASDGLRNAVGQWVARQVTSLDKIGTTDEHAIESRPYRKLLAKNEPALREVLTPGQMDVANRIAETMDQAQRSVKGNRLEGGSDTAQKLAAQKLYAKDEKGHESLLTTLVAGAGLGFEHSGVKGALVGAIPAGAGYMAKTLRKAGLHDIQSIVFDAVMNPDRARQLMKRLSLNDMRERRLDGALRTSFIRQADGGPDEYPPAGGAPPNQPPPTGPFSRGGNDPSSPPQAGEGASRQPNVPLTGAQARILRAAGYNGADIRDMTSQDRARALQQAMDAGVTPSGRLTAAARAEMGGALAHGQHDGRTGDGRFAASGDILAHPGINGRVEPTWHPDADATHQAILAHEKRLNEMASQLKPDASVRDLADKTKQASDDVSAMVRAYHGTPHDVDRFDASKIGSGEGVQAYGHGLYFAEKEDVARSYRDALAAGSGNLYHVALDREPEHFLQWEKPFGAQSKHVQEAIERIFSREPDVEEPRVWHYDPDVETGHYITSDNTKDGPIVGVLHNENDGTFSDNRLNTYRTAEEGREAVEQAASKEAAAHRQDEEDRNERRSMNGARLYNHLHAGGLSPKQVSELLSKEGVAGIRYRDAGSRGADADSSSHNYVVFNDKDISITHRNGEPVPDDVRDEVLALRRSPTAAQWQPPKAPQIRDDDNHLSVYNDYTAGRVQASRVEPFSEVLKSADVSRDRSADPLARSNALAIGDRLGKIIGDAPVYSVKSPEDMQTLLAKKSRFSESALGFYDHNQNHVVLLDDPTMSAAERSHLVLHEGLHAALYKIIDNSDSARALVDHLRQTAFAQHIERGGGIRDHYGYHNAHEFMSEALSSPEFQRHLASIPADDRLVRAFGLQNTPRTMWDAVVGAMRKILGLAPGQHTYLDAAMKLGDHLLTGAETQAHSRAATSSAGPRTSRPLPTSMPPIAAMQGNSAFMPQLAPLFGAN